MKSLVPRLAPPDREWVNEITDIRQRVLALAIPAIKELTGVPDLERMPPRTPAGLFRIITLGAIVSLGRDLGLRRADLQGSKETQAGMTEIKDLESFAQFSLRRAEDRFEQFCGQTGLIGRAFRDGYARIQYDAMHLCRNWKSPTQEAMVHQRMSETRSHNS